MDVLKGMVHIGGLLAAPVGLGCSHAQESESGDLLSVPPKGSNDRNEVDAS